MEIQIADGKHSYVLAYTLGRFNKAQDDLCKPRNGERPNALSICINPATRDFRTRNNGHVCGVGSHRPARCGYSAGRRFAVNPYIGTGNGRSATEARCRLSRRPLA